MSDVRALLKAKREEKRIFHPFAAYNQTGQLRCTACGTIVKHPSAWNGHLGSKSHRTNAARVKEEERLREAEEEEKQRGKRKADEEEERAFQTDQPSKKRRVNEDDGQQGAAPPHDAVSDFPTDFFSDPSRSLSIREGESDGEGDTDSPQHGAATLHSQSAIDLEWMKFQEAVLNTPIETGARETFERATIFAEPELSAEIPEGFPSSVVQETQPDPQAPPTQKDEGAERKRREEEEKELIMDRLMDEELAQEEADGRVAALRAKIDLLKQKRMAAKAAKSKK